MLGQTKSGLAAKFHDNRFLPCLVCQRHIAKLHARSTTKEASQHLGGLVLLIGGTGHQFQCTLCLRHIKLCLTQIDQIFAVWIGTRIVKPLALFNLSDTKIVYPFLGTTRIDKFLPRQIKCHSSAGSIFGTIPVSRPADAAIGIKEIDALFARLADVGTFNPIRFSILVKLRNNLRIIDEFTVIVVAEVIILNFNNETVCTECIKVQIAGVGLTVSISSSNYGMIVDPWFKTVKGYLSSS